MKLRDKNSSLSIVDAFSNLGATSSEIDCITKYMDAEVEDESLLSEIKMRDLSGINMADTSEAKHVQGKLDKSGNTEKYVRYLKAMFAFCGSTIVNVLYSPYSYFDEMKQFMAPAQYIAAYAEENVWYVYRLYERSNSDFKKYCIQNLDATFEAINYCVNKADNAKVFLAGIAYNALFQNDTVKINKNPLYVFEEEQIYYDKSHTNYVQDIVDSVGNLFQTVNSADERKLIDFIANYDDNTEIPQDVKILCKQLHLDEYMTYLLCGTAALNMQYSPRLRGLLKLCMYTDIEMTSKAVWDTNQTDCYKIFTELEKFAIHDFTKYFVWCAKSPYAAPIKRLYNSQKAAYTMALKRANTITEYNILVSAIKYVDPEKYTELHNDTDEIKQKVAASVANDTGAAHLDALEYILGNCSLDELLEKVSFKQLSVNNYGTNQLEQYLKIYGADEIARRSYIVYVLIGKNHPVYNLVESSYKNGKREYDEQSVARIFDMFNAEKLPLEYQFRAIDGIFEWTYGDDSKDTLAHIFAKLMVQKIEEDEDTFYAAAKSASAYVRKICLLAYSKNPDKYKEKILTFAGDGSGAVREVLIDIISKIPSWEEDVLNLLSSKKSAQREVAVKVIGIWGAEKYRDALTAALEKEKSKGLLDLINLALGNVSNGNAKFSAPESDKQISDRLLKGGKIRSVQWLGDLPEVKMADGTPADPNYVASVMLAYSSMPVPGISADAAAIAATLDRRTLALYAADVFQRWLDDGAQAKKKWVLYFASIHGDSEITQPLISHINKWPQESRGAIAAEAVKALALNSAPEALLTVDTISRKFKFKQVKSAAADALKFAASQLGITTEELADRIVPDLGFDENMQKTIDYGTRKFTVRLNAALEVEVFDENGKRLKNLPAPGQKDDPVLAPQANSEFKSLKKSIKATVNTQKLRMELALSTGRRWTSEAWTKLFVKNPIMHQFAMSLIWGVYEENALVQTFRYMEDGTFNTEDEDEYDLPENAVIGLVHPLELTADSIAAWKEQLEDYEVKQCIEQLDRPTYTPSEEELECDRVLVGAGKILSGMSLMGKMTSFGWYKGSPQDGGVFYEFYRENVTEGVSVQLSFSGMYAGGYDDDEVTVFDAVCYKAESVKYGSYIYDKVKPEDLVKISELPASVYSEIALQITRATASSSETNANWRKEKF